MWNKCIGCWRLPNEVLFYGGPARKVLYTDVLAELDTGGSIEVTFPIAESFHILESTSSTASIARNILGPLTDICDHWQYGQLSWIF